MKNYSAAVLAATALVTALVAGVFGCSDLRAIERERCGNQVLESGEDCDTFSAFEEGTQCGQVGTSHQCAYVCDEAVQCPEGWGCGSDGRCRQAAGEFERASGSPWRFNVKDFELGDVDGDGNPDLIGGAEATVTVRFGNEAGEFSTDFSTTTRTPAGTPSITDLNGDGLLDIVSPSFSGLFTLLGTQERTLQALAYAPFEIPDSSEVRLLPVESAQAGPGTESLAFFGTTMELLFASGATAQLPGGATVDDLVGRIPVGSVNRSVDGHEEWALAFADHDRVYLYTVDGTGPGAAPVLLQEITVPGTVNRGVAFADVDGNGRLDVMISVKNPAGIHRVAVAYTNAAGATESSATIEQAFNNFGGVWPLAAGDLNGDGKADYVGENSVSITDLALAPEVGSPRTITALALRTSNNPWSNAAIDDFNGDGTLDAAVGVADTDGIEIFLGTDAVFFNRFHTDTEGPAIFLRSGDFDGDLVADLAFVQDGLGASPDELLVSYGQTSGGPTEPVSMGSLGTIAMVEPTSNIVDLDSLDSITDLVVISNSFPDADTTSVALMLGSSERRLLSPFTLTKPEADGGGVDTPFQVLVGSFVELENEELPARDIIALGFPQDRIDDNAGSLFDTDIWLLPGVGDKGGIASIAAGFKPMPDGSEFRAECSEWTVIDLDGDGQDEIFGIDRSFSCFGRGASPAPRMTVVDLTAVGEGQQFVVDDFVGDFRAIQSIEAADFDGDGDLDAGLVFAGEAKGAVNGVDSTEPAQGSGIVILWNEEGTLSANNSTSFQIDGDFRLLDFSTLQLDSDTVPELVVLTDQGLYAKKLDLSSLQYSEARLLERSTGKGRVEAGDVNGDGIDDICWTEAADVHVYLGVAADPLGGSLDGAEFVEVGQ